MPKLLTFTRANRYEYAVGSSLTISSQLFSLSEESNLVSDIVLDNKETGTVVVAN